MERKSEDAGGPSSSSAETSSGASSAPRGVPSLPPRGLGGGLGGGLPGRPAAPGGSPAMPAGGSGPKLPPRPGMGSPGGQASADQPAASTAAAAAASAAPEAPAQPARPAGAGLGSALPPRAGAGPALPPRAGATPTLPARPASGAAPAAGSQGAAGASPAAPRAVGGPMLPPRTAPAAPAAPAPAPAAAAPPRPAPAAAPPVVAAPPAPSTAVVDPAEDRRTQAVQRNLHLVRVRLIRAAMRLGLTARSDQVAQFLQAIERSERMVGAQHYKGNRRVDLLAEAEREARGAEAVGTPGSPIQGLRVTVLVLGMTGTGKTELINSLLNRQASSTNPFRESTRRVRVIKGTHNGIPISFIDTPGLHASAARVAENKAILRGIRAAYKWHKPDYVFYVDRLDATRPGFGEMGLLGLVTEALGAAVWRTTMAVLTHANAARAAFGAQYDINSRQRRNILAQLLRQAAGDQQTRSPVFLADCHPSCPVNGLGQQVIQEGPTPVPWKQQLLMQLLGYKSYNSATAALKAMVASKGAKGKAAGQPGAPQDMFKQLMRSRLPPMTFFVEQMTEGVMKPEGYGTMEAVAGLGEEVTEDEDAENFNHFYYRAMYDMAMQGDPWAQREYATMLRSYDKARETFRDSYEEADLDHQFEYGLESFVVDPIDFGPTFDPEDMFSHRHAYAEAADAGVTIIPSQDYYGPEHDDPLNGIVMQYEAQPFARHGWGGIPMDLTLCVEKDKDSMCLQGETHWSLVHSVPPFGPRHITQVTGSWEMLRPNIKDVMYQLEVDTFKDGLLGVNDHAGCGLMLARLGEGGDPRKGPTAMGLKLQDTFRVGPCKFYACASKVQVQAPTGGKEEGWGARAFVTYDWLPGVGMAFDFIQERTPEEAGKRHRAYGANFTYDWEMLGAAFGMEVDYLAASESLYVSVNAFSGNDYRLGWVLLLPAWNYAMETLGGLWARLRGRGGEGGEEEGEEGEGEEEEGDDEEGMMMEGEA